METYAVFCPISHSHAVETVGMTEIKEGDFWLHEQDFPILSRCDTLVVYQMDGWKESVGVQAEIAFAGERGIPIEYIN